MTGLLLSALFLITTGTSNSPVRFPKKLSDSELFISVSPLRAGPALIPYQINQPFWSDGADKQRWMVLPTGARITFAPHGEWAFPSGILLVKHFSFGETRPVETRLLYFTGSNVQGASYRWREDGSDAELLQTNLLTTIQHDGSQRPWYFPSPEDCRTCHNANAGFVLGLNARQLNRDVEGHSERLNQLIELSRARVFTTALTHADLAKVQTLPGIENAHVPIEAAARAYLDVNCSFCHRPGGSPGYLDARYETPLAKQNIVDGPLLFDQGIDGARVIAPNDPWRSMLLIRLENADALKMPPLARCTVDAKGVNLIRNWITSLPGPEVTPPPIIAAVTNKESFTITLSHPDAGASIHYTTNGLPPGKHAPVYKTSFPVAPPVTIRARAYKEGLARSITVQNTFIAP